MAVLSAFVLLRTGAAANDRPYAIIPGFKASPEVGIGVGAVAFHSALPDTFSRYDAKILVTTHSQIETKLDHRNTRFLGSAWELRAGVEALRYPDTYYGSGNNPADSDETYYTPEGGDAYAELRHSLPHSFRILLAGKTEWYRIRDIHKADGSGAGDIFNSNLPGHDGGATDLWETGVEYDTRDNLDVPREGIYAGQRVGTSLLGEFQYASSETWINGYRPVGEHWETAGRLWQRTLFGDAPFFDQPYLGDENTLRGVNYKRFRDRSAQLAQAEVRYGFPLSLPIIDSWLGHEWQIAAFGEAGRVGTDFSAASQAAVASFRGRGRPFDRRQAAGGHPRRFGVQRLRFRADHRFQARLFENTRKVRRRSRGRSSAPVPRTAAKLRRAREDAPVARFPISLRWKAVAGPR